MSSQPRSPADQDGRQAKPSRQYRAPTRGIGTKLGASSAWLIDARLHSWMVLAIAGIICVGTISSPPSLLDDVDATYAQVARVMLESGDWVTAHLNGVPYFDKPPGQVWVIALSYLALGVHDWAARLPGALAAMALCWLAWRVGRWSFGDLAGLYAGIGLATCLGLFLFTRVRIPDVYVACTTLLVFDCFLRAQEDTERRARIRARWVGAALGVGLLFKGLIAVVLPLGAIGAYLLVSGQWRSSKAWTRLGIPGALATTLLVAAPWHIAAILQHPPLFQFSLDSGPGLYRGFFWRYFINEHLLRYLGTRHPVDFDRVPLWWFWVGHLVWLFPWSGLLLRLPKLSFDTVDRAGRSRLLLLCACAFTLLFFSASTTQEYYTLPAYAPAILLLSSAALSSPAGLRTAIRGAATIYGLAGCAAVIILVAVRQLPAEGDIASALTSNPDVYTLSLGHFQDLTLDSFAYLRGPLALAVAAFAIGAAGGWLVSRGRALAALALSSLVLLHAAHWAMGRFEPYLSSRPLAEAYRRSPPGQLVLDHEYYAFSSVVFYTNQPILLLNGRKNNIEYGSNAPGAPDIFLADGDLPARWEQSTPVYIATFEEDRPRFETLLGSDRVHVVERSGGKLLLTNKVGTPAPDRSPAAGGGSEETTLQSER